MEPILERFIDKFNSVVGTYQPEFLPPGGIAGGKNVRKVSELGGWKPRKGSMLLNTTASGSEVRSIHGFKNELGGDYHLISQMSNMLKDSTSNQEDLTTLSGEVLTTLSGEFLQALSSSEAFEQATTVGSTLFTGNSADMRGVSAVVGKKWIYADGSGMPVVYSGNAAYPKSMIVVTATGDIEYAFEVRDKSDATYAAFPTTSTVYYVITYERASGLYLYFGTNKNTNNVTATVAALRGGAFVNVSSQVDSTTGTYTHDTDGKVEWTASALDELGFIGNTQGYVYRITFSGAPTDIDITRVRVISAAQRMSLKWDGVYRFVADALHYHSSEGHYDDVLGVMSTMSEDEYLKLATAPTGDYLYIGLPELASIIGVGVIPDYQNTANSQVDSIEVYASGGWTSVAFTDTTLDDSADTSFSQTGRFYLKRHTGVRTILAGTGDSVAHYWYRISWDANTDADVRIYFMVYGAQPLDFVKINGVVEFQGRALYWGHPDYPNRLILSPYGRPDEVCALTNGENLSYPFGDGGEIRACGVLPNMLVVVKDKGVFYTEDGITPIAVDSNVGTINPATFGITSFGDKTMNKEQVQSIAMWQDTDGTYKFDRTGLSKVSGPVDDYFNPAYSSALDSGDYVKLSAAIDPNNNEYHLVLPTQELVYSLPGDEWYPPWERELSLSVIASVKDADDRFRLVGGTEGGFLLLLEEMDNDRSSANAEVAIEHSVKTRTFVAASPVAEQMIREVFAQFKAQASGSVVTKLYKNHATTGDTEAVPGALSLVSSGKDFVVDYLDLSSEQVFAIAFEFICNTIDVEMWINWISIMFDPTGINTEGS